MTNIDYLYNPDAAKEVFDKDHFLDKKLGFQVIKHGTILPYKKTIDGKSTKDGWGFGGIMDSNNKFIGSSHVISGAGSSYTPPPNQFNTALKLSFISACFIVLGDMPSPITFVAFGF